ncbi:MAG: DUF951 domain-containing protein [Chloroflexota bacterium]
MPQQPLRLQLGDVLRLRRDHPCGNFDFEVVRLGADIGLRCTRCNRRIMLARNLLERRLDRFVSREQEAPLDLSEFGEPPAASEAPITPPTTPPADA